MARLYSSWAGEFYRFIGGVGPGFWKRVTESIASSTSSAFRSSAGTAKYESLRRWTKTMHSGSRAVPDLLRSWRLGPVATLVQPRYPRALLPISSITVYNQSFIVPLISSSFAFQTSYPLLILSLAAYQLYRRLQSIICRTFISLFFVFTRL